VPRFNLCLLATVVSLCAIPSVGLGATLSFTRHTTPCDRCAGPPLPLHADLNNDGREDIIGIVGSQVANGAFIVQLSNGDGIYAPSALYQVPQGSSGADIDALAVADFNHDGKADVAAFSSDGKVYLFLNTGAGALSRSGTAFPYNGSSQTESPAVVAGDFNHDSLSDLAFIQYGQLHVWFGNSAGGFTTGPATAVPGPSQNGTLLLGDFDGDGAADLAWQDAANGDAVVAYGNNTGHFLQVLSLPLPASSILYAADVNSDGRMDLVAHQFTTHLNVYYGNIARTFASRTTVGFSRCVNYLAGAADMDGNGLNDLIVGEAPCFPQTGPAVIAVRTRNSNASYNAEQIVYTAPSSNGTTMPAPDAIVLRADHNSRPDVMVQQCGDAPHCFAYAMTDLLNTSAGAFPSCAPPNAFEGIAVCSPILGTSVASPVSFAISAAGPVIQRKMEVWADGKKIGEQLAGFSNYTFLNRSFSFTPGNHSIAIYAAGWDNSLEKRTFTLSVK
jgi:hypothetical protein